MRAYDKGQLLSLRIEKRTGLSITTEQATILRRAELTLTRCAEREAGDGSNYYLERDETTGNTYNVHVATGRRLRTPDLEAGALKRIAQLCEQIGLFYHHQTDPRGCALYVHNEPITEENYTNGAACCYRD